MPTIVDSVIVPNRSTFLTYPPFSRRTLFPELEETGPAQFDPATDLTVLSCVVHPPFKMLTAEGIANHLAKEKFLPSCLGLREATAIQKRGLDMFRAILINLQLDEIHLWRSVVADTKSELPREILFGRGEHYLPIIKEVGGAVIIEWKKFSECQWFKFVDTVHFTALLPQNIKH